MNEMITDTLAATTAELAKAKELMALEAKAEKLGAEAIELRTSVAIEALAGLAARDLAELDDSQRWKLASICSLVILQVAVEARHDDALGDIAQDSKRIVEALGLARAE